jgi:type II secretory pathway predicted ATPase ExeA
VTDGAAQPIEQYESFFGLNESPFSLVPDPRFLFASASHSAALAQVAHALERREPLVVITGDIGTGKTLLCRTVLQRLPFKTFLSVIDDPLLDSGDLVKELLKDFGVIAKDPARFSGATRHELVQTLHAFLSSLAPIQAHAVVMIDEAQHLRPEVLEQIRLLSNIDDAHGTILQIILVGQTDLEHLMARPDLQQLQQRVSRRFVLEPLNREEVRQYIDHRLALASGQAAGTGTSPDVEFSAGAVESVSTLSHGVPRVINLLCDRALELAFASRARTIDPGLVQAAAKALGIGQAKDDAVPAAVVADAGIAAEPPPEPLRTTDTEAATAPASPIPAFETELDPVLIAAPQTAARGDLARYAALGVLGLVLGAAILIGFKRLQAPVADAPASSPPAAPAPAPPRAADTTPPPAPVKSAPAQAATEAPAGTAPAATADSHFDIVVASFRTDARATSVADEVSALGVPVRRREADGWQQVVAGPFPSRTAAEEAQQRIHGAGLTGTQIVPSPR